MLPVFFLSKKYQCFFGCSPKSLKFTKILSFWEEMFLILKRNIQKIYWGEILIKCDFVGVNYLDSIARRENFCLLNPIEGCITFIKSPLRHHPSTTMMIMWLAGLFTTHEYELHAFQNLKIIHLMPVFNQPISVWN